MLARFGVVVAVAHRQAAGELRLAVADEELAPQQARRPLCTDTSPGDVVLDALSVGVYTLPVEGAHLLLADSGARLDSPNLFACLGTDLAPAGIGQGGQAAAHPLPGCLALG
ncbi:hypothetical protein MYFR107205_30505 [Mycolicibacterium frederiksbergense]